MSERLRATSAACERTRTPLPRNGRAFAVIILAAGLAGCETAPPAPIAGPDPSDPNVRTGAVSYTSTIAPYMRLRLAEPGEWRERNEQVTPRRP